MFGCGSASAAELRRTSGGRCGLDDQARARWGRVLLAAGFLAAGMGLGRLEPREAPRISPPLPRPEAEGASMPRGAYFLEVAMRALWHDLNHEGSIALARGKPDEILAILDHPDLAPPPGAGREAREEWTKWATKMREATRDLATALEGEDVEAAKEIWRTRLVEAWKERDRALSAPTLP